jgi:hypothetical protein
MLTSASLNTTTRHGSAPRSVVSVAEAMPQVPSGNPVFLIDVGVTPQIVIRACLVAGTVNSLQDLGVFRRFRDFVPPVRY